MKRRRRVPFPFFKGKTVNSTNGLFPDRGRHTTVEPPETSLESLRPSLGPLLPVLEQGTPHVRGKVGGVPADRCKEMGSGEGSLEVQGRLSRTGVEVRDTVRRGINSGFFPWGCHLGSEPRTLPHCRNLLAPQVGVNGGGLVEVKIRNMYNAKVKLKKNFDTVSQRTEIKKKKKLLGVTQGQHWGDTKSKRPSYGTPQSGGAETKTTGECTEPVTTITGTI